MLFSIKKDIYDKKIILKTCYKFTDDYYIHLDSNNDVFVISIQKKEGETDASIESEFKNELIEFANREMVFEQTKNIREILFARSMASSVIYDDEVETNINLNVDDDNSMKDWFENEYFKSL